MALKLDILANTRSFVAEMKKGGQSVEDITEALDEMARDGVKDADKLERSFRDLAREASTTGRKVGKDLDDGFDKARKGADDFKQEANSTAREAAASFDGSAESIADAFQEVTANAFGGFGAAGAVAGLAAAAGIGLVTAGFEAADEAAKESEQRATEWADAYIAAGGRILSATQVLEAARAIIADPEQYKLAKKNAEDWGVSESVALLAMSGNTNALAEARDSLRAKSDDLADTDERVAAATAKGREELTKMNDQVRDGTAAMERLTGDMDAGSQKADVWSESLRLAAENTEGATTKVDEFGDSVTTLPGGKQIYIDAETGQATDNVDAIEQRLYSLPDERVIRIRVQDETQAEMDRIVANINNRRASLGVNVYGIGGKQLL